MRGAPPAAVGVLTLLATACGGGAATAQATPSNGTAPPAVSSTSGAARSTTASVSFGSPVPATASARATPTPRPSLSPGASIAARPAAPTPVPGPCTPADLSITTTTDMSHYAPGQTVNATVVVRNMSAQGCVFSAPGEFTIDADSPPPSSASTVFTVRLACGQGGCTPLAPGQMSTYPIFPWNQTNQSTMQPVASGDYHARAAFSGYQVSSAPFTIG